MTLITTVCLQTAMNHDAFPAFSYLPPALPGRRKARSYVVRKKLLGFFHEHVKFCQFLEMHEKF